MCPLSKGFGQLWVFASSSGSVICLPSVSHPNQGKIRLIIYYEQRGKTLEGDIKIA